MQRFNLDKILKNNNNFIKLKRVSHAKSETGIRQKNEDYAYCGTNKILDNLLIVSDGVGSCRGSEKAAELVSKTFIKSFLDQDYLMAHSVIEWFEKNIKKAKLAMSDHVLRFSDHFQMCTTLVLALTIEDDVHIFWIGDSRAYIIAKKGWEQITNDHNLLNYLVENETPKEEIEKHGPNLYTLTNCITISTDEEQKYDYTSLKIKRNMFIFLASDGFYNFFSELDSLYDILTGNKSSETISNDLIDLALNNESNDNISFSFIGFLKS